MARTRMEYAIAARSRTQPYMAVGSGASPLSPIQRVAKGTSDSQNRRCRFAHSTSPLIAVVACDQVARRIGREVLSQVPETKLGRAGASLGEGARAERSARRTTAGAAGRTWATTTRGGG